jgi:hypothetical protein
MTHCYAHYPMSEPSCALCREDIRDTDPGGAAVNWRGVDAIRDALGTLSGDSKEFREVWGTSPDACAMQDEADAARDRDFLEED